MEPLTFRYVGSPEQLSAAQAAHARWVAQRAIGFTVEEDAARPAPQPAEPGRPTVEVADFNWPDPNVKQGDGFPETA